MTAIFVCAARFVEAKKRNEEAKRIRSRKGHPRRWKGWSAGRVRGVPVPPSSNRLLI